MWAAVSERVQLLADAIEADATPADVEHLHVSLAWCLGEWQPRLPFGRAHDRAAMGTGSRKKSVALRQRMLSRQSAGSCRSVCSGSSKSQWGKSLAYIRVSEGRRNSIARSSCAGSSGASSGWVAKRT